MKETYKIQDLEQIRLLSDPFKLQLIRAFAKGPKTTKQVAMELDESVTKLYRHVDALYDAGLLEVVEEKKKRGTIERTFQAIARMFEADYSLFNDSENTEGAEAGREILRAQQEEMFKVLAKVSEDDKEEEKPVLMRIRGKVSEKRFLELRDALESWLRSMADDDDEPGEKEVDIGGMVAFYRIDE